MSVLHEAGAVLFRGFDVQTAKDFNDVVEALGTRSCRRWVVQLLGPTLFVGFLQPMILCLIRRFLFTMKWLRLDLFRAPIKSFSNFCFGLTGFIQQVPEFPSKLFFFCEVEPESGGETPIVLSHVVYERMKQSYPEFVEQLEQHGLLYTRVLGEEDDPSSPIGRGWKSTFLTEDKSLAEERAAKLGMKLEWMEDGGVKTIMGPIPAIKYDKSSQRKIWFNNMVAAYTGWKDKQNDPVKAVTFGDGKPLPADILYDCLKILEEESVAIPWQKSDVLLIDNWAVLHARRSFNPPRRILASLCK
ncbi:hypothetical protein Pint_29599 [Pistacia integerrima]|uniref:Uncharacterized protein n=1 Tax=Pistacia integerrima TaxID=434235 RepID=A0ACC0X1P0_9ROSI|nr:hypothetical protein Pint_29599 [Pistacia integerrima]